MWRFVLTENIRRFQLLIARARSQAERDTLQLLLEDAEHELAELEQVSTPEAVQRDAALRYVAEHAVDEAVKLHDAQFSTLQIYDEARKGMIILAQRNFRAPFLHHLASVKPGDGSACGRCLQDGRQAAINDVDREAAFEPHRQAAREAGFEAVQATPVRNRSERP